MSSSSVKWTCTSSYYLAIEHWKFCFERSLKKVFKKKWSAYWSWFIPYLYFSPYSLLFHPIHRILKKWNLVLIPFLHFIVFLSKQEIILFAPSDMLNRFLVNNILFFLLVLMVFLWIVITESVCRVLRESC